MPDKPKKNHAAASRRTPSVVVGIGASAGGLEALTRFFKRLKPDLGMAYVVVQHLSPDYESSLPEILQRATAMPVATARDGAALERDRVYVIAPRAELGLRDGRLVVEARHAAKGHAMPIDHFLRALAKDQKRRAVAVILSGSGHDGTLGVRQVKGEGGLVFAQDKKSAGHREMPQAAMATGSVDLELAPEEIAVELERISGHPYLALRGRFALPQDDRSLKRIFALVRASTGVDFSQYKSTTVGRRLQRRLMVHKLDNLERYARLLERDPAEVRTLCEETLIHVTQFFREPEVFKALVDRALPRILKSGDRNAPIRVWAPGCSTGEEAYSLAICLLDALGERVNRRPLQVFATDVSEEAVDQARAGAYPASIAEDVPARLLSRFFTLGDRGYVVSKTVRESCVFAKQNLAKDPPFANLDLISCRNVLIYLESALQKKILGMFHYALKPSGALLLGSSETVSELGTLFTQADKKSRLYFKKQAAAAPRFQFAGSPPFEVLAPSPHPKRASRPAGWPESDVQRAAERLLLARYAPAGVVVDADLEILHFRGPINRYLKPASGRASLNLLKMLPEDCHVALRALFARARKIDAPARQAGVSLEHGEERLVVDLEVVPFQGALSGERCFIVLFEPAEEAREKRGAKPRKPPVEPSEKMRKELAATRDQLQAVIEDHEASTEELKAANEEIISSNEELQSTNEELETAKEELQAANEELTTLNEELQTRNADLNVANNDLINLLASVHLPIVMLGSDLRIRRFTPLAERLMNLIPSDVGRPIRDIKPTFEAPHLETIVAEVIESVTTREVEVRDRDGRWYSLRVRPYKTAESKIDGAVLVLVDIDAVKKALLDLRERTLYAEALFDMVREPLVVLASDFTIKSANAAFQRLIRPSQVSVGRSLLEIGGGRWSVKVLREALEALRDGGDAFAGLPVVVGDDRIFFSGRRLVEEGSPPYLLLAIAAA